MPFYCWSRRWWKDQVKSKGSRYIRNAQWLHWPRGFCSFSNNLPLFLLNQKSSLVDIPMLQFTYAYIQRQEAKSKYWLPFFLFCLCFYGSSKTRDKLESNFLFGSINLANKANFDSDSVCDFSISAQVLQDNITSLLALLRESVQLNLVPPGHFLLLGSVFHTSSKR